MRAAASRPLAPRSYTGQPGLRHDGTVAGLGGLGAAIAGAKHGFTDTWLLGVVIGAGLGAVMAAIGGYAGELGVFLGLTTPSKVPLFAALGELVGVGAGYEAGYQLAVWEARS